MATEGVDDGPKTLKIENTQKRDTLIETEKKYQKTWAENKVYESNAPSLEEVPFQSVSPADLRAQRPKFFGTVPYPYSNGSLHLGHAFTISKVEFASRYARLQGKNALFPFAFHCTGMPIKACADRLLNEIELFGTNFERYEELEGEEVEAEEKEKEAKAGDVSKFSSSKSKASAKTAKAKYQFQIMLSQGIPKEEIHRFADPFHWVHVFPEMAIRDATNFGLGVDWRRSFVTTDANPFYDSFVRWQMNKLKGLGKIKFGKRYTVYSPKDKQACMDHDRSEGEGITVQEYTAIKMQVLEWSETGKNKIQAAGLPSDAKVYFVAATLRPETMYGQTCCFVGPKVKYGIYKTANDNEYLFITERAARNIAYQPGTFAEWGQYVKAVELNGADVIGTLVDAPLSVHNKGVRVLPMETVKEAKGTGVVTCVPSDSPDDYATTVELGNKPDYYGIKKEWVSLEIIPIIKTPTYGDLTAPELVKKMKIVSPKDPRLPEAKEAAYKEGFYQGVMIYGQFSGRPVQEAKVLAQKSLIDSGNAFNYAEPDGLVISRSKDVCVAGHLDQWYLNYGTTENGGDGAWCDQVLTHLQSGELNTFSTEVKRQFESTLGWLSQWACARSYGLGSKLPWDTDFLVESLSDSTIYQSYYTIAHYLHSDLYGQKPGLGGISAPQMTDAVWDYITARSDQVPDDGSNIPLATLQAMRREFEYWYPLDLRVSGKDLIQNHLTFFLYIHVAMFSPEYWPRGIRANGHLLLNGEKMSKSTGNFLTLRETVEKYGADAARIALANAGDSIDDANFEESVANKTILKLYELRNWIHNVLLGKDEEVVLRGEDEEMGFWDKLFENHLNQLVAETKSQYDQYLFKNAIKIGFYDLTSARDFYQNSSKAAGIPMHRKLIHRFTELQALILAPVAPHWSEHVWLEVLEKKESILKARWPETELADPTWLTTLDYIQTTMSNVTAAEAHQQKKLAKGKRVGGFDPKKPFRVIIFFTKTLPEWQDRYINLVTKALEELGLVDMNSIGKQLEKKETKRAMPFIKNLKDRIEGGESKSAVLSKQLPFDEKKALTAIIPVLAHMMTPRCGEVRVFEVQPENITGVDVVTGESWSGDLPAPAASAVPGAPTFHFENLE
ncbi:hypothetical protein M426DRAFT_53369 [Hypoxylon sp. CI-4A]|nr:hypothetical protein M426DRAFT_53369 [Hypoxylon sp. CI-4A]